MSEPESAFFKLRIDRGRLVQWLDAPVMLASQWTDWRGIGGRYYNHGVQDISDFSEADMAQTIAKSDAGLRRFRDTRAGVRDILSSAEAPHLMRASYSADSRDFVAGSLTYAENLIDYPTPPRVGLRVSTMPEDLRVRATRFFQGVRQDR